MPSSCSHSDLWDITDTPTTLEAPPLAEPSSSTLPTTSSFLPEDEDIFYTQVATNVRISPNSTTDLTRHAAPSRLLWSSDIFGYTLVGTNLDPSPIPPKGLTPARPSRLLSSDYAYNTQLPFINNLFYNLLSDQGGADLTIHISELNVQPLLTSLAPDTEDFFFTDTDVHTNLTLPVPESPFPAIPTPSQTCINLLTRYHPGAAWPLWGPPNTPRSTFPSLAEHPVNLTPPYVGIWDQRLQRSAPAANQFLAKAYQTLATVVSSVPPRCDGSPGLWPSTCKTIIQPCLLTQEQLSEPNKQLGKLGVGAFGSVFRATLGKRPELGEVAVKQVKLKGLPEVQNFGTEVAMLAQLSEHGGADSLAVYGCSLSCGEGPDELLGHIYLQKAECSMADKLQAMGAETARQRKQWEGDSSISLDRLRVLIAGREITDAATFLGYLVDVARQLACLHRLCIVHGDVKLENIMIMSGKAFLIDFGLSVRRPHGELYSREYRGGTDLYRAPECMSGLYEGEEGMASETLDVYAFGLVIVYVFGLGDPQKRFRPAFVRAAFEVMHEVLLSASADLDVQAVAVVEQADIPGSAANHCLKQLSNLTELATSRAQLRAAVLDTDKHLIFQIDLSKTWLVWEEAGCAAQLVRYVVGIATFNMPQQEALVRVYEVEDLMAWVGRVMAEFQQLSLDVGCLRSLKDEWDLHPFQALFISRIALYPN
ncbi:MAG: hypothetical protein WDW38_000958 [Sanguina aurantia]